MKRTQKYLLLIIALCFFVSGCATTGNKLAYDKNSEKFKLLDDVSDEKALETYILIYNVQPRTWEIETAKNLSLEEFLEALKKRKSKVIKESGVFELEYDAVDLSKWSDAQVLEFYDQMDAAVKNVHVPAIPESTDDENALRIIYMTAREAVAKEGNRREGLRNLWMIFGKVANIALAVAISII